MDRNLNHKGSEKRQCKEYVYLLQGLLRCGSCGHKMSPKSGTGRSGDAYPYYTCGYAEKSKGFDCKLRFVPAESLDDATLEFLKQIRLKPEILRAMAARAVELTSQTAGKLRSDLERVQEQLGNLRSKIAHLAEAVAEGGKAVLATLRPKMEALDQEREELEASEARLKIDLEAEQGHVVAVEDQVQTLSLFHQLIEKSEGMPERIKALVPRFIDYVVWHGGEKGEAKLEVALFSGPVEWSPETVAANPDEPRGSGFAGEYQMAPRRGLEPRTLRLTAARSTIELPGNARLARMIIGAPPPQSSAKRCFSPPRRYHGPMDALCRAISFAARRHHGQMRKDKATPYVAHPFRVMFTLRHLFNVTDLDTLVAGVLHDTIEDTNTDFDDIEKEFGAKIAGFVAMLTKDKRAREKDREDVYFASLQNAPIEVKLCKLADSYDNVHDCRDLGPAGQEKAREKARRLLSIFEPGFPKEWAHALEHLKSMVR